MVLVGVEQVWKLIKVYRVVSFQNNLGFSLYAIPSTCYLVITLGNETEFKRECFDRRKYIALISEFSVNSSRNYD